MPKIKVTVHTTVVKSSDADAPTNAIPQLRNLFDGSPASPFPVVGVHSRCDQVWGVRGKERSELRALATAFKLLDGRHRRLTLVMARLIALKKHRGLPTNIKQSAGKECSEQGRDGCR